MMEDHPLSAPKDEMENLVLHDGADDNGNGNDGAGAKSPFSSNYRSAMSTISESHHHHPLSPPILATPADSDPLLSPNPSSPDASSYLDPPSNAEAVFTPFDGDTNGIESPSSPISLSRSPSSSSEYLKITVSNPVKEQETSNSIVPGSNNYVTYLITTKTNIPEFGAGGADCAVRRRFRDVVTLSDRLAEAYRGFFIPPRPDKSVVESQVMQKQEFVEQRRMALEKYLRRLAAHPVIRKSDEFRVFLQVQGRLPLPTTTDVASRVLDGAAKLPKQLMGESVLAPHEVMQPARGGMDLMRLFKELRQSVANDWGGSRPSVVEEDKEFLEKKEKIQELEQQITGASQQVLFGFYVFGESQLVSISDH